MIKRFLFYSILMIIPMVSFAAGPDYDVSLRDSIIGNISGASISDNTVSILRYGAKGDGVKDCRKAFGKAMREAEKSGGIHIVVPAGEYFMDGPLHLQSNVCIELEEGAVLKFTPDPSKYPIVETSWEGTYLHNYSPFIYGYGLHDVAIIGKGTIDGNAMSTFAIWKPNQKPAQMRTREMNHNGVDISERTFGEGDWLRPHLIQFYDCRNVTLEGVKIINSPFWCVHLLRSENIICRSLRYDAKLVNNDGIDPESSRNILIEDIYFDNGDDNIAIKSGRDNDGWTAACPSENIVIRRCHFKGLHAVVIGSEMSGGVRNVFVENCDYAGYCKRGIYVKTNPDRGGYVKNLVVNNCSFDAVEDLFYVTSKYAGEGLDSNHFSEIEGIYVNGLSCSKASQAALVLQGTRQKPISNVVFDNISVGEAKIGISFSDTKNVSIGECHIGGTVDVPTQVTPKDNIFGREPIDTLSYSLGYTVTISLFAGENPLVTNEEEFSRYIAGIEENINMEPKVDSKEQFPGLNSDDPSFRMSYSLGGMQAVFLFDGLEGRDASRMPPVDCIVAGLREVADGMIGLPADTIKASEIINSYSKDMDPMTLEGESKCEFFRAYGIMKAMAPDIQELIQEMAPEKGLIADRKAYAMGIADYLEESSRARMPENAYDLGKMIADTHMIESIPFKLDIPSFIEGAKAVWGFGLPLIPLQRMTELLEPYL